MAGSLLFACVSTDSGPARPGPSADAAEQNYHLGAQYYRKGNFDLALARLKTSIELDPKYADAHSLLAMTYVQIDNKRLANESFERAVRLAPNNIDVRNAYAVFLCQEKQFDEARKHFDKAISNRENDNSEVMLTNAGVCMVQKPDYEIAEAYFREALRIRPTYGEALIQLASLKHTVVDDLLARAFLQRYLAANQATAASLYLGVRIESALGDDRAVDEYQDQIFADFPDSAEAKQLRIMR